MSNPFEVNCEVDFDVNSANNTGATPEIGQAEQAPDGRGMPQDRVITPTPTSTEEGSRDVPCPSNEQVEGFIRQEREIKRGTWEKPIHSA